MLSGLWVCRESLLCFWAESQGEDVCQRLAKQGVRWVAGGGLGTGGRWALHLRSEQPGVWDAACRFALSDKSWLQDLPSSNFPFIWGQLCPGPFKDFCVGLSPRSWEGGSSDTLVPYLGSLKSGSLLTWVVGSCPGSPRSSTLWGAFLEIV